MIRPALSEVEAYRPGLGVAEVRAQFLGLGQLVKLGSNELALPPLETALDAAAAALARCSRYPDPWSTELRTVLAAEHRVEPDQIVLGNGADELIRLLAQATLDPGDGCLFAWPGFPTYRQAAMVAAARLEAVAVPPSEAGVERLLAAVCGRTRLVCFANPNNPTGAHASAAEVEALVAAAPSSATVLLDEAYHGFVDPAVEVDGAALVAAGRPNLCVLRTFSKAYGLAGLRVGYAVTSVELATAIEKVRTIFNVNVAAQAAALAALAAQEEVNRRCAGVRERRRRLDAILTGAGLRTFASEGNFVFCVPDGADRGERARRAAEIADRLLERGVIVRRMDGFGAPDGLRVTVGTPDELDFLAARLAALAGERGSPAIPGGGA